ncbi:hypothetical protein D3C71_2090740 [compost metagenome]
MLSQLVSHTVPASQKNEVRTEFAYLSLMNGVGVMISRLATPMALPPTASSELQTSDEDFLSQLSESLPP